MEGLKEKLAQLLVYEQAEDLLNIGRDLSELRNHFEDELLECERVNQIAVLEAKDKGETIEGIDYAEIKSEFFETFKKIQELRKKQIALKETLEKENLRQKKALLDDLKKIIEGEENISLAYQTYNSIHETWKKIGDIPRDQRESVQKEYSRLLEFFFYTMRIYREIKSHDYKRNFQLKQAVIHRLQSLRNAESNIHELEPQLKLLQDEWEGIGPVNNAEWESIKASYWEAVRSIYDKINLHYDQQRQVYTQNIESKKELIASVNAINQGDTGSFGAKDWEQNTQKIMAIQEQWKKIGPGSKKDNEITWKTFRKSCDAFFELKKAFFKVQGDALSLKVDQKKAIVEEARLLQSSTDWKGASDKIIKLQAAWKTVGFAGSKWDQKLWAEFRTICDAFFTARQAAQDSVDAVFVENLTKKEAVISAIAAIDATQKAEALAQLKQFSSDFSAIGPVPRSSQDRIYKAYKAAMDAKYNGLSLDTKEKDDILYKSRLETMLASPDKAHLLQREKMEIRKQIDRIQQDIIRLETNIGFFAKSKGADALKLEVQQKVDKAKAEIDGFKRRLKAIPNE